MFLGKGKLNRRAGVVNTGFLESLGDSTGSTEVGPDFCFQLGCAAWDVLSALNGLSHLAINGHPVGAAKHGAGAEECERVVLCAGIIDGDVPKHVFVNLLGEVDVDAQEVRISLGCLDFRQETLEPTKRWSITANPEEFNTAKRSTVALSLAVPYILENGGKGSDTDTGSDQDSDLDIKHILSRGAERTVDANGGESESAVAIEFDEVSTCRSIILLLGALHRGRGHGSNDRWADTETVAKSTGEVTDLSDVDRNIGIFGGRGDGERMPLEPGDFWDLDEEPLACSVLEARLDDAQFHSTTGMHKDLGQTSGSPGTILSVGTLPEVHHPWPDSVPPAEVAETVLGRIEWERGDVVGINGVADEASSSVRVQAEHEEEGEMVRIPECFEALGANFLAGGAVHEQHDEQHEVARDATRLGVVDLEGELFPDLSALNIDEIDIVSRGVDHRPECHRVGDLSVEPDVLVGGEKPCDFRTDDLDDIAQHGDENETSVKCEHQTGTAGSPDGVLEPVQGGQFSVDRLTVPSIAKEEEMKTVEYDVEGEPSWRQELSLEPILAHGKR